LLEFAKKQGKVKADYTIPLEAQNNTPQRLKTILTPYQANGMLPDYPFGTDLTEQELALGTSLRRIQTLSGEPRQFVATAIKALFHKVDPEAARPFLQRMQLERPSTIKNFLIQKILLLDLDERGLL
jgi:hypothetical protein